MKTVLFLAVILALVCAYCPNSCQGHGNCQQDTNLCNCDDPYTGADCSQSESYTDIGNEDKIVANDEDEKPRMLEDEDTTTSEETNFDNATKIDNIKRIPGFGIAGGILSCGKDTVDVIYYTEGTVIVREYEFTEYENITWSSCRIIIKRNDLSMIKPITFDKKTKSSEWINPSELTYYKFTGGDFNLVCTVDNSNVNSHKDMNNSAIFIKATYKDAKWETKSEVARLGVCYPLVGINNNQISIDNSDVFNNLIYKEKSNYYFGVNPNDGVEININDLIQEGGKKINLPYEQIPSAILPYIVKEATLYLVFTPTSSCSSCTTVYFVTKVKSITEGNIFDDGEPTQEADDSTKADRLLIERELKEVKGIVLELEPPIPTYLLSNYAIVVRITKDGATKHSLQECSDNGVCDRTTGLCKCNEGFTGVACQILSNCPNNCNNYGRCVAIDKVLGIKNLVVAGWNGIGNNKVLYGCKCDEGHRGPDCSLLECPSSEDPQKATNVWKDGDTLMIPDEMYEQRDCSGRGICDYGTGTCKCFDGFKGTACEEMSLSLIPPGIASTIIFLVEEANPNPVIVTGNTETVVIAAAGFIFGWVAQKSRVFNPGHIKHQFQFTNWIMLKFFISATITSQFVYSFLAYFNPQKFQTIQNKKRILVNNGLQPAVVGGCLAGIGMYLCGACPGMIYIQFSNGIRYSIFTFIGCFIGALVYGLMSDKIEKKITKQNSKPRTACLDEYFQLPFYHVAPIIALFLLFFLIIIEYNYPWRKDLDISVEEDAETIFEQSAWNPIYCGILVGLLQIPIAFMADSSLGTSSSYITLISQFYSGNDYFSKFRSGWNNWWQVLFMVSALFGGYISYDFIESKPSSWLNHNFVSPGFGIIGGFLLLFGSRLGRGCASGNGISGIGLLSTYGFLFTLSMFVSAIISCMICRLVKLP